MTAANAFLRESVVVEVHLRIRVVPVLAWRKIMSLLRASLSSMPSRSPAATRIYAGPSTWAGLEGYDTATD